MATRSNDLKIEFANNGVVDSLTGVSAPNVFRLNLKQATSNADRNGEPLTILTVRIHEESLKIKSIDSAKFIETSLISLAKVIKKNTRGGDFFSRISELGFWILLHGDKLSGVMAKKRLIQNSELEIQTQLYSRLNSMSGEKWIKEIDSEYFPVKS